MANKSEKADFGLIGLGVMGQNLALNIEEKGFSIAVHNRSTDKVDEFVKAHPGKKILGAHSLQAFTEKLTSPRRLIIMVKAGAAVDATIDGLLPHLSPGDVVIDGGNELFVNTERRAKALSARGLNFVGMGVSGGEEGAPGIVLCHGLRPVSAAAWATGLAFALGWWHSKQSSVTAA